MYYTALLVLTLIAKVQQHFAQYSHAALQDQLKRVKRATVTVASKIPVALTHHLRTMNQPHIDTANATVESILDMAVAADQAHKFVDIEEVWSNIVHASIMKAECHLFQYLNAVLKSRCSQVIAETLHSARSTPALGWLDRLIITIHTGCQSYSTINMNSSPFIPDYIVPEQVTSMKSRSRIVGEEELIVETHRLLRSLLTKWFNIPCHFRAQAQQHLVQELLDHSGASVLYLPQTWIVYSTCPKWLLSPSIPTNYYKRGNQSAKYDKIYLEPFVLGLTSSPICVTNAVCHLEAIPDMQHQ